MIRRSVVVIAAIAVVVLGASVAFAAWTSTAAGSATAQSTTLLPPAGASGTANGTTAVTITVTAGPAAPSAPASGYRVDRVNPTPATGVCYITSVTGSCSDTGLSAGDYSYNVFSVIGTNLGTPAIRTVSWSSAIATGASATIAAAASSMTISSISGGSPTDNGKTGSKYFWGGTITVVVQDNLGASVQGAAVSGGWTYTKGNGNTAVGTPPTNCTTDASGTCTVVYTNQMQKDVSKATYTVSGVTKSGLSYALSSPAPAATIQLPTN